HQLQAQHLSHHAPPIPLTPHPSGVQSASLSGLGSASGLLALSGALGTQAHLVAKDDRGLLDADRERDPGPSSLMLSNGERMRAISDYLNGSKKRKTDKEYGTDYVTQLIGAAEWIASEILCKWVTESDCVI
ncbi:transducin-like enhancer protein 1, partial [Notechis scutatus]|uniref:Transducin-like enhancer protein 1 n=1 Tax=Notechis scutatus TaxID=8663 RepID=A0A6J1VZT5_9SAUR